MPPWIGGGGGPILSWDNLQGIPRPLTEFISAPRAFIVGAIISVLLDGIQGVVEAFLTAILAVFDAIAYIPLTAESVLSAALGAAGRTIITSLGGLFLALQSAARVAGPFAPILAGLAFAAVIVAGAYAARFAYTLLVDTINPL